MTKNCFMEIVRKTEYLGPILRDERVNATAHGKH